MDSVSASKNGYCASGTGSNFPRVFHIIAEVERPDGNHTRPWDLIAHTPCNRHLTGPTLFDVLEDIPRSKYIACKVCMAVDPLRPPMRGCGLNHTGPCPIEGDQA